MQPSSVKDRTVQMGTSEIRTVFQIYIRKPAFSSGVTSPDFSRSNEWFRAEVLRLQLQI